jgi:hypothetical protein
MLVQLLLEGYSVYHWTEINNRGFGSGLTSGYGFRLNPMRGTGSGHSFGYGDGDGSHFSYNSWSEGSGGSSRVEYGIKAGSGYDVTQPPFYYVAEIKE